MLAVRAAALEDAATLIGFASEEALEAEGRAPPFADVERGVGMALADPSLARYWVLVRQGEIVGSISVTTEWSDWRGKSYWYIQSVYLRPEVRGSGALAHLLEAIEAEARGAGAAELRLYVHPRNERALRAYRRYGFDDLPYRMMTRPF